MKRNTKHTAGTVTMVGIPVKTKTQKEIVKLFDIKLLEEGEYPHRSAKLFTMMANEIGINYDWENDNS